jgi:hypothetical protein
LLEKTVFQVGESYELDLILTDEETSSNVCLIWMVHNETLKETVVSNAEKLQPKPKV